MEAAASRRAFLKTVGIVAGGGLVYGCAPRVVEQASRALPMSPLPAPPVATPVPQARTALAATPKGIRPELFREAMAALESHGSRVPKRDRIAIADFTLASSKPRFHFVNLADGSVSTLLVAHGRGSDPAHTGFLQRFSNQPGSNATSEGAYLTSNYYFGSHGKSQRLIGLDPTNNNALDRAIVIHGAWYANADMIAQHGKLGRSEGCLAVGEAELARVFDQIGEGRMIFATKMSRA